MSTVVARQSAMTETSTWSTGVGYAPRSSRGHTGDRWMVTSPCAYPRGS
jgi:hypothetical protein